MIIVKDLLTKKQLADYWAYYNAEILLDKAPKTMIDYFDLRGTIKALSSSKGKQPFNRQKSLNEALL